MCHSFVRAKINVATFELRQSADAQLAKIKTNRQTKLRWIIVGHFNNRHQQSRTFVRRLTDSSKIFDITSDLSARGISEPSSDTCTQKLRR